MYDWIILTLYGLIEQQVSTFPVSSHHCGFGGESEPDIRLITSSSLLYCIQTYSCFCQICIHICITPFMRNIRYFNNGFYCIRMASQTCTSTMNITTLAPTCVDL